MKIVTIHQPEHLPWLGFFAKMARADLLISLDSVPFRRRYFQNRNRILGFDGQPLFLTVPVRLENHHRGRIADVPIADDVHWRRKYLRTLEQRYGGHPHSDLYTALADIVGRDHDRIAELNHALIATLADRLRIGTPVVRASELGGRGRRSELLAELCRRAGADVYLSGPSGRDYLDPAPFLAAGIRVRFHDYVHPVYAQAGSDAFVSHLSIADLLFNCGDESRDIVLSGSRISDEIPAPASSR